MSAECNNQNFVKITNKDIYEKICAIETTINGNGKKGLKQIIESHSTSLRILWIIVTFVISGLIGGAVGGVF